MSRIFAITLTLTPTLALAHPGDHGDLGFVAGLTHALSQSYHLGIAVAVLVGPVVVWRLVRGRR